MSNKLAIILTIALAASPLVKANLGGPTLLGGATVQSTDGRKSKLLNKLSACHGKTDKRLETVSKAAAESSKLVAYATQVVAGYNELAIFKLHNNKGFVCLKIWNKLDRTCQLTHAASVTKYSKVKKACDFGENFVRSYTDGANTRRRL